jgi:hypothetical protein
VASSTLSSLIGTSPGSITSTSVRRLGPAFPSAVSAGRVWMGEICDFSHSHCSRAIASFGVISERSTAASSASAGGSPKDDSGSYTLR